MTKSFSDLDVVIVTFDSAPMLPGVLGALPDEANVFVVDNASRDGSADVAEAWGATVVRGRVNAGFGAASNRGAGLGSAELVLFLNPDAVIDADSLERLVQVVHADPRIGVVSPRLVYPDGSLQRVQWPYPSATVAWREAVGLGPGGENASDGFVIGACFLVRREAFEAVGGFDVRFWLYGEEADLCRRIADLGWTIRRVPSAIAVHAGGASGGADPTEARVVAEHFVRGGEHFVAKHGGRGALVSYRFANLVGSSVRGMLGVGHRSGEHRRRITRHLGVLWREPGRVALDSPATRAVGRGVVICSSQAWSQPAGRARRVVEELLSGDPDVRVLFVEPTSEAIPGTRVDRRPRQGLGLRPADDESRVLLFSPGGGRLFRPSAPTRRQRELQVIDAVSALGFVEPRLWIDDSGYAALPDMVSWAALDGVTDDSGSAVTAISMPRVRGARAAGLGRATRRAARSHSAAKRVVVNARFRQRPVTGVERYATELDARLPSGVRRLEPSPRIARPPLGHMWEQTQLPLEVRADEVLWSPCNTGPLFLDRHVVTVHDLGPTEHPEWFSPRYGRWLDLLTRRFVDHALHVVTDSEFIKGCMCDVLGADPERISVVPPGVGPKFIDAAGSLTPAQRTELAIDDGPYLLSVATAQPRKNLASIVRAFGLARETIPGLRLVVAGTAGPRGVFTHTEGGPERAEGVHYVGYVRDALLPGLYAGAEALVYAPFYEGFGLPPLEAAATGTPSVLSDIPVLRELGLPATWVDPDDIESIAAGMIERVAAAPIERQVLRGHARRFTWERSFSELIEVFGRLDVPVGSADSP